MDERDYPSLLRNNRAANIEMTDEDFVALANLVRRQTGISFDSGARQTVYSRLATHVRRSGSPSFAAFVNRLLSGKYPDEMEAAICALTTNTTRFFREPGHFSLLERDVVPGLREKARAGKRVRIWSAACSSGEEPFSIAAVLLHHFPDVSSYDVRILATDIDRTVLEKARLAQYRRRCTTEVDQVYLPVLFGDPGYEEESLVINEKLRDLVTFRYLNFVEPWPVTGPFDVIFCRNVAIYLDADIQAQLWSRLESVLGEDGTLFIGHSERLSTDVSGKFFPVGRTAFKRRPASRSN